MAISAATVFELRAAGSDNNGGGFVSTAAGTDRSQADSAFVSGTKLTVDGTTNTDVAPDGHTPAATDVGNIIQITAGAGFSTGFYEILSIQSGKWRLDRSPAATSTSGGTWALGGALASPGKTASAMVSGNKVHQKSGTYTVTSTSTNVANGCVSLNFNFEWTGYGSARNDNGTRPIIIADGVITTFVFFTIGSSGNAQLNNLELNGNSRTSSRGIATSGATNDTVINNCVGKNFTNRFLSASARDVRSVGCYVTGCATSSPFDSGMLIGCVIIGNTVSGVINPHAMIDCISANNSGAASDGVNIQNSAGALILNCTFYNNGRHGVNVAANAINETIINTISYGNASSGFNTYHARVTPSLYNCAAGGNGTDYDTDYATAAKVNCVTLSGNPFTNAGSGDFSLDNTSGEGAACRAAGAFGAFNTISTTGYMDIGAVQAQSSSGGGGFGSPFMRAATPAES